MKEFITYLDYMYLSGTTTHYLIWLCMLHYTQHLPHPNH